MESGSSKKVPYSPSETKRYEISEDEFSRNRIKALRDIHHELEKELGVPLSFSIFGSLVKGKVLTSETVESTDIDMYIDFDLEALPNLSVSQKKQILKYSGMGMVKRMFERPNDEELKKLLSTILGKSVLDKLAAIKNKLGYAKDVPNGIVGIRALDKSYLENRVDALLYHPASLVYYTFDDELAKAILDSTAISIASFFTLSIGSPVKKYRNDFLAGLASAQDQEKAEQTWQGIKIILEETERKGRIPEEIKKQFPQTLEEALKFYGVVKKGENANI